MDDFHSNIKVTSFNCKNVKSSVTEIYELCENCDILVLQETWLLDSEIQLLTNLHSDFYAKGISSVNTGDDILRGRPHAGIAILWKKAFGNKCNIVDYNDNRLLGIEVQSSDYKILIVNVYMPFSADIKAT